MIIFFDYKREIYQYAVFPKTTLGEHYFSVLKILRQHIWRKHHIHKLVETLDHNNSCLQFVTFIQQYGINTILKS